MKITLNTNILQRNNLSLGEFLILLLGFYECDYDKCLLSLYKKKLIEPDLYSKNQYVFSNNTKNLITHLLISSDDKIVNNPIDFESLAQKLQSIYPDGYKPGTTYHWRSTTDVITQKLMTLVAVHGFTFTEEEAIQATQEYVNSFGEDKKYMYLLRYFLLRTTKDADNNIEIDSPFMTIIENNRNQ